MDLVQLRNEDPTQPFVATLLHDSYCRKGGSCECQQESYQAAVQNPATGAVGLRDGLRAQPKGVSIGVGKTSEPFARCVVKVPGFKEAIQAGRLAVIPVVPVAPQSPPAAEPPRVRGRRESASSE